MTVPTLKSVWISRLKVLENLRTLWAIKYIFYIVTYYDSLAWIGIREPISLKQIGLTSQTVKNFHNGLTWPIFIQSYSNLVQRSFVSLKIVTECLMWLKPFFYLPAWLTKTDKLQKNWTFMKFGMGAYVGPKTTKNKLDIVITFCWLICPSNQNWPIARIYYFCVFHLLWNLPWGLF